MSGGVDSSVTARLLSEKVRNIDAINCNTTHKLCWPFYRTMISPPSSCGIGTLEMSPERTRAANGKKTGRTCSESVASWMSHAEWCAHISRFVIAALRFDQVDLSREYWLRVFEPCLSMWEEGYTPNPDIWCNK